MEDVPEIPVAMLVVWSPADPSWLRSNFVIPEDDAGLAALCDEIEAVSPPLRNLPFTNRYLLARVGRAALSVVSNLNFLSTIEGVSSNEATHRARALMARVSIPLTVFLPLCVAFFLTRFFYLQSGSYFMYMSRRAKAAEAAVGRVTDLETQRLITEAQASELEEALNIKSMDVDDLTRSNVILQEKVLRLREDLELSGKSIGDLEERNMQLNIARDKAITASMSS